MFPTKMPCNPFVHSKAKNYSGKMLFSFLLYRSSHEEKRRSPESSLSFMLNNRQ